MLNFILATLFWTVALYGLLEIIIPIIYSFTKKDIDTKNTYLIVTVKNGENNIEGIIRVILSDRDNYNNNQIIIVDLNSKDNTEKIVNKLCKDNDNIKKMSWEECKNIIDQISLTNS